MDRELIRKAEGILAGRRQEAETSAERRKAEMAEKIPEIARLKAKLSQTSARLTALILQAPVAERESLLEKMKEENLADQRRIRQLLEENGYPADYLTVQYHCPRCEDRGYLQGKRCSCMDKLIKELGAARLNRISPLKLSGFDSFRLDYYPDEPDANGIIPRKQMEKVYRCCMQYAADFTPESEGLLLIGGTGLGKTHLSLAVAGSVIEKGYQVIYGATQDLFRQVEKEHFGRKDGKDTLNSLIDCDLLLLDDLGAEFESNYYTACLYHIINSRMNSGKPTIVSTNLGVEQIQARYSDRIVSRLFTKCRILRFSGKDIRQLKRMEKA